MRKLFGCLLLLSLFGLVGCQCDSHKANTKSAHKTCYRPALEISADK